MFEIGAVSFQEDPQIWAARTGWVLSVWLPPVLPQKGHWDPPEPTQLPAQPCHCRTQAHQRKHCTCCGGKPKGSLQRLLKTFHIWSLVVSSKMRWFQGKINILSTACLSHSWSYEKHQSKILCTLLNRGKSFIS